VYRKSAFQKTFALFAAALFVAAGCNRDSGGSDGSSNDGGTHGTTTGTDGGTDGGGGLQVLPSRHPRVRFKGGARWSAQLARGLDLDRDAMCQELGLYDCASKVHKIALGGVEPYRLRIDDPLPAAPITAPIAVNRIALSACSKRAKMDTDDPDNASVFKELSAKPSSEDLRAMGNRLYQRLLSRDAEPGELDEFEQFWTDVQDEGPEKPQLQWATMSCFAVATSTEMLFY